jgi:alpha-D-ribose 1-methylphosphonate 5-triphosphate synthase subunit PhnH
VSCQEAEVLLVIGPSSHGNLTRARHGSEERPQDGATAVYVAHPGVAGTSVRVQGPGVDGHATCRLPVSADELAAREQACRQQPRGVDVLLISGGQLIGLPRTTRLEVLS